MASRVFGLRLTGTLVCAGVLAAGATPGVAFANSHDGSRSVRSSANPVGTGAVKRPLKTPGCEQVHVVKNVRYNADALKDGGPGSTVTGQGGSTISLSNAVSHSNSYTATPSVSAAGVSAAVGFSVTSTSTTTASYSISPKGKGTYTVFADGDYNEYVFDIHLYQCGHDKGKIGIGYADQWYSWYYGWYKD